MASHQGMTATAEHATGVQDKTYNLVSVLYHALQGGETCQGCDRSIPKTCAVDHLCQCWRFAYLIDMRVKSNGWGANDFQPSRWEEMSYQVNVKHASRHTTKMRIPQALDF